MSTIRKIKYSASKGDISASFQMYENYKYGQGVEQNDEFADREIKNCATFLNSQNSFVFVDSLMLNDYRRFKKLEISFDRNLTVIIGQNGKGKTTIAAGLAKILSWVPARIEKEKKPARPINTSDINVNAKYYGELRVSLSLAERSVYESSLSKPVKGAAESKESDLGGLTALSNLYRITNSKYSINLPLFAYYSADRSLIKLPQSLRFDKLPRLSEMSRFDAYEKALDEEGASGEFSDFLEWFVALDSSLSTEEGSIISKLDEMLESLGAEKQGLPIFNEFQKLKAEQHSKGAPNPEFIKKRKIVIDAIKGILCSVDEVRVDRSSGRAEVMVVADGNAVNISQLSHGQKVSLSLAADLARRLVTLNPQMKNPLEGNGVVIIDEIELHLHPEWQQRILLDLQTTFPNIQFIVTTHSPQVLSVVDKKCIRILDETSDLVTTPEYQTKGVMSSDILERIMGTLAKPVIPITRDLEDMHQYIAEGRYSEEPAQLLFSKLKSHFGSNHPEISECESLIKLSKFKRMAHEKRSKKT